MKKLTIILLLISFQSIGQPNAEIGFSSRLSPTIKAGIEAPIRGTQWNVEMGVRMSKDNLNPIVGLQGGYSFIVDRYNQELRLAIGGYFHSGILYPYKTERVEAFKFGGSIRFKWSVNVYCQIDYNGETFNYGLGYVFKKRKI